MPVSAVFESLPGLDQYQESQTLTQNRLHTGRNAAPDSGENGPSDFGYKKVIMLKLDFADWG
jgi:hypothetical protein